MFLCVSPNPAIDKRLTLPSLVRGEIHRSRTVQSLPGGKATHVAMVLHGLGDVTHWIGLCGGAAGAELVSGLRALGIKPSPFATLAETRTNLEIIDDQGAVTEIRERLLLLPTRSALSNVLAMSTLLRAGDRLR
jgi:1-phosphofructokinase